MKSLFLLLITLIIAAGCNPLKNSDNKKKNSISKIKNHAVVKEYKVEEGREDIIITPYENIEFIKILNGLDSSFFKVVNNSIKLDIKPLYSNPQDSNRDNIYETKVYIIDKSNFDYTVLIKVKIFKKGKGDENSTSPERGGSIINDLDGDYIPDNIEKLIGMDSKNPDENCNGILDGLEGDSFFDKQWYIKANGTPTNPSNICSIEGNDLNLLSVYHKYMGYNRGVPIIIQVVDSGVDIRHEDLKANIDLSRSLNNNRQGEPTPDGIFKPHGTMVAGIIAARAFNRVGVRGVAPFAKIAGSNWLAYQSLDGLESAWLSGSGANEIAVSNNSWGRYYSIDTFYEDILAEGSKRLRGGKGRVYVFASGNAREFGADANLQYLLNNQYPIVVGAITAENKIASYSTPGANLWICAYGGSSSFESGPTIATTYLSGESIDSWIEDLNRNYTYAMAGSSAAAPMVSASIGLILEACPNLTWRDVKYILAKSAKVIDSENGSWITNGAGIKFSRDYGFGLINTKRAIDICKDSYHNLPKESKTETLKSIGNSKIVSSKEFYLDITTDKKIEWVEATINLDTQNASDYDIYLTSPAGTRVLMLSHGTKIGSEYIPDRNWMNGGFRFGTGAFLDESSEGLWRVQIVDTKSNQATLKSLKLTIYGH